jgi:hypothetical protein
MDTRARQLIETGDKLFAKKRSWDELGQEIAENYYPMRSDFTRKFVLGDDFCVDLMDSYPVQARETLGNMPNAMLRQGDWFQVKTGFEEVDEQPDNARWLEYATKRFRTLIYDRRANLVRATGEADHDYVSFGNAILSVEESPAREHFLFRSWHPRDCAWMENEVGKIDHMQRHVPITARNAVKRWPKTVHADTKQAAEKDPSTDCKVRHIVLPFDEIYGDDRAKRRQYKGNPFCSLYVDCDHEIVLGEGPLPVFSYVVPRWRTLSGFAQGFSPATANSLPDGRMLQSLARIILEQGEKAVDPPTIAKGEIFRDAVNLYAGGMTYVDLENDEKLQDVYQTINPTTGLSIGMEMKQDVREMIAEAFLLNKLMLPDTREMTAFETNARLDEFRRAALPFFGPIEAEYHLPLLDVAFQMAVRNRAFNFAEMPDALADADVTFNFDSPLHTAEGRQNVQAFQESIQIIAAGAQFDNTVPAKWNLGKMVEDAVRGTGAPVDWENDEETQASEEDRARQIEGLKNAAAMLSTGAGVAGQVADATVALKQAGLG